MFLGCGIKSAQRFANQGTGHGIFRNDAGRTWYLGWAVRDKIQTTSKYQIDKKRGFTTTSSIWFSNYSITCSLCCLVWVCGWFGRRLFLKRCEVEKRFLERYKQWALYKSFSYISKCRIPAVQDANKQVTWWNKRCRWSICCNVPPWSSATLLAKTQYLRNMVHYSCTMPPVWLPNGSSLLSMLHESWVGTNWPIHRGKTFFQQRERERSHCTTFLATGKGFNLKFRIEPIEPSKSAEAQLLFLTPAKALFCICFASRFVIDTFCGWEKGAGVYQNGWCLPQAHAASFQLRLKEDANHSGCMQ